MNGEMSLEEVKKACETAQDVLEHARWIDDPNKLQLARAVLALKAKLEREQKAVRNLTDALVQATES